MEDELNKVISESQRDSLIRRVNELYDSKALKVRDWMAIYDIFIEACNRGAAEAYEQYIVDRLEEGDGK